VNTTLAHRDRDDNPAKKRDETPMPRKTGAARSSRTAGPRAVTWALCAIAAAALIGCGGSDSDDDASNPAKAADAQADKRAGEWLAQMTLDEKIQLVHGPGFLALKGDTASGMVPGIPRLGIPDIRYKDSGSGIGDNGVNATAFPSTLAIAASWDTALMAEMATRIAQEGRTLGYSHLLGGGANLAREPRNGRTFEYLGEDPVLAGELMVARTDATQAQNVVATIKHLVGNEQEANRFASNSVIDERTLRELYLLPFEMTVVRSQPGNVMCAYNLVNNEKSCESKSLLTYTVKDEWGFKGVVQSDWFAAINGTVAAANAGLDEEQPGSSDECASSSPFVPCFSYFAAKLKQAVNVDKTVAPSRLDDMVQRKLRTLVKVGLIDNPPPKTPGVIDPKAADGIALKAAQRSMVLLKNTASAAGAAPVLPLAADAVRKLVVIGGHADVAVMGGGGSAQAPYRDDNRVPAVACLTPGAVDPAIHTFSMCATWHKSSPLAALRNRLPNATVTYLDGADTAAATAAAAAADVAIVFGTQYLMEAVDRPNLALPDNAGDPANQAYDQNALIQAVAAAAPKTVVVLETGTAVTMPWLGQVHSVLQAWYPGVQGGEAIADVLTGRVNPSGKLPLTFPRSEADLPQKAISTTDLNVVYSEGLKMGYRWYDAQDIEPLFPFGHGLSYTSFRYSGLEARSGTGSDVTVSFTLTNTGAVAGTEVAQVYASLPPIAGTPPQRLVAFKPVELAAGASQTVSVVVPASRFAIWDRGWTVPAGAATLKVGGSSRDAAAVRTTLSLTAQTVDHAR
jgi:beta-glucosidase